MDQHIELLYSHRQFWALPYFKDNFFPGMTTIECSESINSYIKKKMDVKTSLVDFLNQVGVVVNIRNQVGEEAKMHQKYHNLHIITNFPIEEHTATILTPHAFQLLQHEIEFHIINCNHKSSIVFRSLVQCLEVETLKTKDRVEVATKELERVTC
ncbi:hypothetical protein Lal_00035271 [Lupinus albus]|nr:hypothetical protein Lal_00035271 [Lupinus albus]